MDVRVEQVDPASAPEADLRAMHALEALAVEERFPDDPPYPFEEYVGDLRYEPEYVRNLYWAVWSPDRKTALGLSNLRLKDKDENRNKARCYVTVHPSVRRQGVASSLLRPVVEAAIADARSILEAWVPLGKGSEAFAEAIGFEMRQLERMSRCYVNEVDRLMLEEWVRRAKERASDYVLRVWEGPCPEEFLTEFAAAQAVMNTAPQGDRTHEWEETSPEELRASEKSLFDAGFNVTKAAAFAPDGRVAGYTEVYYGDFRPQMAWQGDTGVWPEHRNRGIGRWLKAAMLLHLYEARPLIEFIETGNAASNDAMLAINHAMGFRLAEEIGSYEVQAERLRARLA